jgi:magnesium-transporting ATPase (P-type)
MKLVNLFVSDAEESSNSSEESNEFSAWSSAVIVTIVLAVLLLSTTAVSAAVGGITTKVTGGNIGFWKTFGISFVVLIIIALIYLNTIG